MYPTELNTPKVELEQRVSNSQIYLQNNNIEGWLILQRVDLFYFTETIHRREPVLVDYVFVYNGDLSDHARIFLWDPCRRN